MPALQVIALETTTPQLRAPASGDTYSAPRALDITPETLTGSSATSSLSIAQTWNTSGTPTAIDLNVTDTASNASSLLMNLRVGGVSRFRVQKDGAIFFGYASILPGTGWNGLLRIGGGSLTIGNLGNGINLPSDGFLSWGDVSLTRDAANTLAQRNGANAQAFNIYNTYTDASNYQRVAIVNSATYTTIQTEHAGTGGVRGLAFSVGAGNASFFITTSSNLICSSADSYGNIGGTSAVDQPTFIRAKKSIVTTSLTVATLPSGALAPAGARAFVTDSTVAASGNFGAIVAGGGANAVPVYSDGTNWRIG